jgi:hypothetical protein
MKMTVNSIGHFQDAADRLVYFINLLFEKLEAPKAAFVVNCVHRPLHLCSILLDEGQQVFGAVQIAKRFLRRQILRGYHPPLNMARMLGGAKINVRG